MKIIHLFSHLQSPIDFCLNAEEVNWVMLSLSVLLLNDIIYGFTVSSAENYLRVSSQIYFWNMHNTSSNKRFSNSFEDLHFLNSALAFACCFWFICSDIFSMLIVCPFVVGRDEPHWKIRSGCGEFWGKVASVRWAQEGKMSCQKSLCFGTSCLVDGEGH